MVVSPSACRERFKLEVGVNVRKVTSSASDVSAVVEYGQSGLYPVNGFTDAAGVVLVNSFAKLTRIFVVVRVFSFVKESFHAVLAPAGTNAYYVEKNTVAVIVPYNLFNLRDEVVEVGGVHAKLVEAGIFPSDSVVFRPSEPFRMLVRDFLVKSG